MFISLMLIETKERVEVLFVCCCFLSLCFIVTQHRTLSSIQHIELPQANKNMWYERKQQMKSEQRNKQMKKKQEESTVIDFKATR